MPVSTLEPTARMRRSRTRTPKISARPALVLSTLKPHQYDLRPACASLICPDCTTWVPITGIQAKVQKLVPHHTSPAGEEEAIRCSRGSNRQVIVDVKFEVWWQRLQQGVAETDGRRATRVTRKPKTAVVPAVTQILAPLLDANAALKLYRAHRKGCPICKQPGHTRCTEGGRLAHLYTHKQRTEPARRAALTLREDLAEQRERGLWLLRELQWASTAAGVRRTDIQRVHDALEMKLKQLSPKLNPWEHADFESAIAMLARRLKQLSR
ncbi:hypothetical protein [Streptomyces malaysiensis]|uniref:Uncharacterized protein n=1 Tax=Streptomyces malaysiensis subsp. samsunensis TaxID=459658 RepID=A0A9X2RX30_STRMQ|nr:hypothetical protein [Streptomyces samsunensis]MCQ8833743.1 hypothetical protein [Streptomyces samsunensis]